MLVLMFLIYGIILVLSGKHLVVGFTGLEVDNLSYITNTMMSFFPIYSFWLFSEKGFVTEKKIRLWMFVMALTAFGVFYLMRAEAFLHTNQTEVTNNGGYILLSLIPLIPLTKYKLPVQIGFTCFILAFIATSFKKGAIIIGLCCLLFYIYYIVRHKSGGQRIGVIILSSVLLIVLYNFFLELMSTNFYFAERIEEFISGEATTRDDLYSTFTNHFLYKTSILSFLFGSGAYSTIEIYDNFAHNDWLELAVNQGVLGIVLYLLYWFYLIRTCKTLPMDSGLFLSTSLFFIIYFLKTFFSMSYDQMTIFSTLAFGYCLSYNNHPNIDDVLC